MRQLFLLRHAKSSWDEPGLDDFERPLSGRGRKAARAMAGHLHASHVRPALILCSAARRARATYDILEPRLEGIPVSFEDGLYEAGKGELLDRLHQLDDHLGSVMLIGHNPGLERLAAFLCANRGKADALARLSTKFPTGALAVLESDIGHWAALGQGTCRLSAFVRPADLEVE